MKMATADQTAKINYHAMLASHLQKIFTNNFFSKVMI